MTQALSQSDGRFGDAMDTAFGSTPQLLHGSVLQEGCGCAACAGSAVSEQAGDGLGSYGGGKQIWSTDQVVNNFLRSNSAWSPGSTILYSFRDAKPAGADSDIRFEPLTQIERDLTRLGFDLISDLVNLTFVEAPDDRVSTGSGNRIYFGKDTAAPDYEWGHASRWVLDGGGRRQITSAEVWISSAAASQRVWFAGGYNFQALMHEALHTLGLPHPGNYNADGNDITYQANAQYAQDSRQFTIMSYFAASNTGADHLAEFVDPSRIFSGATPLLHDVAALQALYGANMSARAGDTVYGYNSTADRQLFNFATNTTPIFTIWDGGGRDRLDFSQTPFSVNLDLRPGMFSDAFQMVNNISIAFNVVIEDAVGGSASDRMLGNEAGNRLQGGAGDDEIQGLGGDDRLEGGDGSDLMGGQDGADVLDGGAGRDNLFGDAGNDLIVGGTDDDRLHGQDGDDLIGGQDGADYVDGGPGRDNLFGDAGNDVIIGGEGDDRLHGQDGDDTVGAQDGNDYLDGGSGRDNMFGDAGDDLLIGGANEDRLYGQDGDDLIGGQDGDDYVDGGSGRDNLFGDAGADFVLGGANDDRLHGQDGDDLLAGQDGDDFLDGGAGRDILYGDAGVDFIFGGDGADDLHGGAGADRFVFNAVSNSRDGLRDRIFDFDSSDVVDVAAVDADVFAGGDQAFAFVGVFSGSAGQAVLSYDGGSNTTTLSLDVNGDGVADFRLDISGQVGPGSSFVL